MDRWRGCCLLMVFLALGCAPLWADSLPVTHPPAGKVRIVGLADQDFATIQAAIDQAPFGGTVLIGAGRYDERLMIGKPITLVGAGAHQTAIGPTAETRHAEDAALLARIVESQARAPGKRLGSEEHAAAVAEANVKSGPIISIKKVEGVALRSLRVNSPGSQTPKTGFRNGYFAVEVIDAGLHMSDCAVVGCRNFGVVTRGSVKLDLEKCLIAGCLAGVYAIDPGPGWVKIKDSDLRNCLRTNVWVGKSAGDVTIEDCRLSGTSEGSIHVYCAAAIRRNAIFENAQLGILAADSGCAIEQNVFYRNQVAVVCSTGARSRLTGNLFLDNKAAAVRSRG
ncbi:MAG TPA: right-handed parallel beta-helix repeat-containing protein, partial [Pirellulales bacterium]